MWFNFKLRQIYLRRSQVWSWATILIMPEGNVITCIQWYEIIKCFEWFPSWLQLKIVFFAYLIRWALSSSSTSYQALKTNQPIKIDKRKSESDQTRGQQTKLVNFFTFANAWGWKPSQPQKPSNNQKNSKTNVYHSSWPWLFSYSENE